MRLCLIKKEFWAFLGLYIYSLQAKTNMENCMNNKTMVTIKKIVLCIIAGVGIWFTFCENSSTSPTDTSTGDIRGSYLMDSYCIATEKSPSVNAISIDSLLKVAECDSEEIIDCDMSKGGTKCCLSMSTIFITGDSLVRFGYHCPGDRSGSTRIAYKYVYNNGQLTGDSLSGDFKLSEGERTIKTFFKKNSDESIVITQLGSFTSYKNDSTYYTLCKSTYKKSDSTCFNYNSVPTCIDNNEPWFPIPLW
jgi:hypothetical protein